MGTNRIKAIHFEDGAIGLIQKASDRAAKAAAAAGLEQPSGDLWLECTIEAVINKRTRKFPCEFLMEIANGEYRVEVRCSAQGEAVLALGELVEQEESAVVDEIIGHMIATFPRWEKRLVGGSIDV